MPRFHLALLTLLVIFPAPSLAVSTFYVGTCKIGAFGTIQAAVNSDTVPAGSVINVCPGNYPEQVVMSKSLTLQGIFNSNSSQAVIAVPSGGLTTTSSLALGGTVAAQVEVIAATVNITNITVDGTATSTNCPSANYVGIFYAGGSSGTVNQVETRNQTCNGGGTGIVVENGAGTALSVTIENSNVNNFSSAGIWACSNQNPSTLTALIKGNFITGGPDGVVTTCNSGEGGITNVAGSVSGNIISAITNVGVFAESASSVISGNTITGGLAGIDVLAPTSVTSNRVSNSSVADIAFQVPGATVKTNSVTQAPVGIEFNCWTGTVSGNIINGTATGIDTVPAAFTGINTFRNVAKVRSAGAC